MAHRDTGHLRKHDGNIERRCTSGFKYHSTVHPIEQVLY